jgi:hypothetical protein
MSVPGNSIPAASRTALRTPSHPTTHGAMTSRGSPSRASVAVTASSVATKPIRRVERVTAPPWASRKSVRTDSVTSSESPTSNP